MRLNKCPSSGMVIPLAVIFLAGCGGSSTESIEDASSGQAPEPPGTPETPEPLPSPPDDFAGPEDLDTPLTHVGYIGIEQLKKEDSLFNGQPRPGAVSGVRAYASLTSPGESFTVRQYSQAVLDAQDTCTRYDSSGAVEGQLADIDTAPSEFLEGGEVITVTSQQGTYTELLLRQVGANPAYSNSGEDFTLPLPVPEDLVADIPGSEFPVVSGIGIPTIEPLVLLGETTDNLLNPTFRWVVGPEPGTRVVLSVNTVSADGGYNAFICEAVDDGEFSAPDWAASGLEASASTRGRTAMRHVDELTVRGDTLVVGSSYSLFSSSVF